MEILNRGLQTVDVVMDVPKDSKAKVGGTWLRFGGRDGLSECRIEQKKDTGTQNTYPDKENAYFL